MEPKSPCAFVGEYTFRDMRVAQWWPQFRSQAECEDRAGAEQNLNTGDRHRMSTANLIFLHRSGAKWTDPNDGSQRDRSVSESVEARRLDV